MPLSCKHCVYDPTTKRDKIYDEARNEWVQIDDTTDLTADAVVASQSQAEDQSGVTAAAMSDINQSTTLASDARITQLGSRALSFVWG